MKTDDIKTVTTLGAVAGANSGLDFAREIQAEMERMGYLKPPKENDKTVVEPRRQGNNLTYGNKPELS